MISHEYKCIFVHIPKTAGTSIEQVLGHFQELKRGVQDHRSISEIEPLASNELIRTCLRGDIFLLYRQLKKVVHDTRSGFYRAYQHYFKFAFVRNPWSRVFSWYNNVMRDEAHQKRFNIDKHCTFNEFLRHHMDQYEIRPQMYWLLDKKKSIPMDFIGRFENLPNDFQIVANRIGLEYYALPRLIAGSNDNYTNHYDGKMREIVLNRYKEEIKLFKFEYGE